MHVSRYNLRRVKSREKLIYKAPRLKGFGDFRALTLMKGLVDKDSVTAPLRTRVAGGPSA